MRFTRFMLLGLGLAVAAGCGDDVTNPSRPPVGGVRFINALADTSAVDIRMIDQVEWSANASNLNFRAGTEHFPTEAKQRQIRVFAFTSGSPTIPNVSQVLHEATITVTANRNVTLLLTGSARAGTVRFEEILDDAPAVASGQVAVRSINASTGAIDVYYVPRDTSTLTGAPAVDNLASLAASPYVTRAAGVFAARATPSDAMTIAASRAGPTAPSTLPGATRAAGVDSEGSAFSVYYFPRGVAGSPQTATTPAIVWFVDARPLPSGN